MTRRILLSLGVFSLSGAMLMAAVVRGQDEKKPAEDPKIAELGSIKQAEAREKLQALEETMDRLARLLGATEPDKALKLREAFATSRKRLLREGMDRVVRFIEERKLYEARETQDSLVQNLQDLLDILLEKDIDPRELIKAVRELRDIVKDLDQIIQEETSEKIASDDAEAAKDALSALKGQKERLEDLIEAEKAIEKSVAAQQGSSSKSADSKGSKVGEEQKSELEKISKSQKEVEEKTAALRKDTANDTAKDAAAGQSGSSSGSQGSPSTGEGQGQGQSPETVDPKKLDEAEKAMAEARKAMRRGDPKAAARQAKKAREALESARGEAEEKLERLRRSRDFAKMKKDQDDTKGKTDDVARRMRKTPPLTFSPEGGVPGRKDVEEASKSMEDASQGLSEGNAGEASPDQQKALDRLQRGRKQAEQALAALQQALRDRILAYLRERITFMLEKQIKISRDTRSLNARLRALVVAAASKGKGEEVDLEKGTINVVIDPAEIDRKDLQRAERLSRKEGALVIVAEDVIDLLDEDGTTLVFPKIVGQVRRDLETARDRLAEAQTGEKTQIIQKDIELTLREILEAIKQAQKRPPPPNPNQGRESKNGTGPLLPKSSELKMVLSLQQRVNRRTRLFDLDRSPEDLSDVETKQAKDIADNQGEIEDLLKKIARSLGER